MMSRMISLVTFFFALGIIGVNLSAHARKNQDDWNNEIWKSNQAEFSSAQSQHLMQQRNFLDRLKDIKTQSESRKKRQNPPTPVTAGTTTSQTTAATTTSQTTAATTTSQTTASTTTSQTTAGATTKPTNAGSITTPTTATTKPTNPTDNVLAHACRKPVPPGEDHSSLKCYQCSSNTSNDLEPICDTRLWKYLKHSEKTRARSTCHPKLGKFCVKTVKQKYGERITRRGCFGSVMQGPDDMPIATRTGCVSYTRNGYLTTACFCNHNYCNKTSFVGSSLFKQLFQIMIVFQVYVHCG